jgi:amino acid transporter
VIDVGIANALAAQVAIARILYSVSRTDMLPASGFLSKIYPRYRTPFNATLFVGVVTLAVALIFAVDTITKFVNFGALTAFVMLNISVFFYFVVKRGRRSGSDLIRYLLFPLLGFAIIASVWSGFDRNTFIFGFSWLALGIVIGVIKTRGFRKKPRVVENLYRPTGTRRFGRLLPPPGLRAPSSLRPRSRRPPPACEPRALPPPRVAGAADGAAPVACPARL